MRRAKESQSLNNRLPGLCAPTTAQVAQAALDVWANEPPKWEGHPLVNRPDVVCTPHLGASTTEAQEVRELVSSGVAMRCRQLFLRHRIPLRTHPLFLLCGTEAACMEGKSPNTPMAHAGHCMRLSFLPTLKPCKT